MQIKTGNEWAEVCFVPNKLCHSKDAPIQQGSDGLLRKANHFARESLIAATEQSMTVSAEHVGIATTEIF